jgi:acetyl esterase/lipase
MKIKTVLLFCLILFIINSYISQAQVAKPPNWSKVIQRPWYQGYVSGKPVFVYLDPFRHEESYFFVADKSLPDIYEVLIDKKKPDKWILRFRTEGKKIKARFAGDIGSDTLTGIIRTSRRNARRLAVPAKFPLYMALEKTVTVPRLPPRYISPVFSAVEIEEDISFGAASGYYTTMPLDKESDYDYQQIILDALKNMYVSPTKMALLHILNNDPVSLALTDLQGLRLDLYQPLGDTLQDRPLLLLLHGGAFIIGDKATSTMRELAYDFARKGYVVASINYRMGFNPASKSSLERSAYRAVQDARAALRFLSYNARTYHIDPDCIFLGGSSAGAITALNAAFMKDDERPESAGGNFWQLQKDLGGLDESTNDIKSSYTIRAVANLWGAVNDTNLIEKDERIPVLSFHGDADKIVPFGYNYPFTDLDTAWTSNIVGKLYGSLYINRRLIDLGIHSELVIFPGSGHEPQYEGNKYTIIMDTITKRVSDFYFRGLFYFPEIKGSHQVPVGTPTPTYTVPANDDIACYWQVTGGKIIPGSPKNQVRVAWLAEDSGNLDLVMVRKNQADLDLNFPVMLPEKMLNFFPATKK